MCFVGRLASVYNNTCCSSVGTLTVSTCEWYLDLKLKRQTDRNDFNDSPFAVGRQAAIKKPWTFEEKSAVEKSMSKKFIERFVVPGKNDCTACIKENAEALKERDWRAVKFYVKNRITALKRKAAGCWTCQSCFVVIWLADHFSYFFRSLADCFLCRLLDSFLHYSWTCVFFLTKWINQ